MIKSLKVENLRLIRLDLALIIAVVKVDMVVAKAKKVGVGWALIRNLTHQGALGYYSQMIAEKGMAGIIFVCNPPNMAPFGAKAPGVHNSPIAISVPAKRPRRRTSRSPAVSCAAIPPRARP